MFLHSLPPLGMSKAAKTTPPQSFETALAELEGIVAAMEAGQLPLEQSIAAYRRGAQLLQFCQNALKEASQQVRLLEGGTLREFAVTSEAGDGDGPQ